MYFDFLRVPGTPIQFFQVSIPVTYDTKLLTFTYLVIVATISFILITPGFRGITRLFYFSRISFSLFIIWVICMGVFGQNWEEGYVTTITPYKVFNRRLINATVGVRIGLSSVNITLKTDPPIQQLDADVVETIDFNERFEWDWRQGREGYSAFAGKMQQQYRFAQYTGAPLPILWVAEHFTIDEEQIRWGRSYRTAGWFTWGLMLTSLPTWVMANLLSFVVAFYAGLFFLATGLIMLIGNVVWASIRWGTQPMPINLYDTSLTLSLGSTFYLVLAGGLISCGYGITIVALDYFSPQTVATYFGIDALKETDYHYPQNEDELQITDDIEQGKRQTRRKRRKMRSYRPMKQRRDTQRKTDYANMVIDSHSPDGGQELRQRRNRFESDESSEAPPSYREGSYSDINNTTIAEDELYFKTKM